MSCGAKDIANWANFEVNPEYEADEFASELLLPSAEMKALIGTQWPSLKLVSDLAGEFEASLTATIRKYCDVATQSCAGVWVQDSRVVWFSPSTSFPHWVKVGEELDAGLLDCNTPLEEMVEVRASEWIPAFSKDVESTLFQGCVKMPTYRGSLVLLWAKRQLKHRTVEDELLEDPDSGFGVLKSSAEIVGVSWGESQCIGGNVAAEARTSLPRFHRSPTSILSPNCLPACSERVQQMGKTSSKTVPLFSSLATVKSA